MTYEDLEVADGKVAGLVWESLVSGDCSDTELRRKRNEFDTGNHPYLIGELNRDVGFTLGNERRIALTARELQFRS